MMDKVQKIREEVARRLEDAKAGVRQNQNRVKFGIDNKQDLVIWQHLESMAVQLLSFIDSMQEEPKFKVGDTIRYLVDGDIRTIIKVREDNYKLDDCSILHFTAQDNWELVEDTVSTKDKLLALSDGRLHIGWIDDAKVVEFEECLMQFHEDMNNIPQGTDSLTRLKDTDRVLHSYSKKLMSMAKEEPVSEDLEKASKEWLAPKLDKSYANYGEVKMMELTHFDGYAMLNAIEFGAKWQKENLWKPADGDDLPEIDREVVVFTQNFPDDAGIMSVSIAHRPNPNGWDGKSVTTGKVEHYTPKTYDKGGWNISDVKYWLDIELPKEIELWVKQRNL